MQNEIIVIVGSQFIFTFFIITFFELSQLKLQIQNFEMAPGAAPFRF
jgi:hypothetical protein